MILVRGSVASWDSRMRIASSTADTPSAGGAGIWIVFPLLSCKDTLTARMMITELTASKPRKAVEYQLVWTMLPSWVTAWTNGSSGQGAGVVTYHCIWG